MLFCVVLDTVAWDQKNSTQWTDIGNISTKLCVRTEADAAYEKMLDPIAGSPATGKSVAGITSLFLDDLFGTGGAEVDQSVLARLRKEFPSCFKRLEWCVFHRTEFVGRRILDQDRELRQANKRPPLSWKGSQWNETRKKISIVPLQRTQGTEAFWDR